MGMRIGINGAPQITVGATSTQVADHAARAEADGFASYWVNQPLVPDALTLLTVVGQATESIELGTAVVPTWTRHPLMLAAQALTTQEIVGDRLVLGIGLAHKPSIEGRYRIPFERPAHNMAEYLDVLLPALQERVVDVTGEYWSASVENLGGPGGVEAPAVMLAAMGPRMLELAGARTDGNVLWLSGPRTIEERVRPAMQRAAESADRPLPRIVASVPVCVTDRAGEVRDLVDGLLADYNHLPSYRSVMDFEGVDTVSEVSVIGTEDEVRGQLDRFAAAGASDFAAVELTLSEEEATRTRELLRTVDDSS